MSNLVTFKQGEHLVKANTPCDCIFMIKSGQLEVYKNDDKGNRIPLGIITSGQFVGESAAINQSQHTSNVVALTDVQALKISKKSVDTQLEQLPQWLLTLIRGLISRLRTANQILREHGLVDQSLKEAIEKAEQSDDDQKAS